MGAEQPDDDIGSLLEDIHVPQAHVVESLYEDDGTEPSVGRQDADSHA